MKTKKLRIFLSSFILLLFIACTNDNNEEETVVTSYLDTLIVPHSLKGYELYSWQEGNSWYFSILVGTNRIKTFNEVTSNLPSEINLITVAGIDTLKLALARFPESEYITWIGQGWLQSAWGSDYGNLQLPPQNYIDDIKQFCYQKKLNLQVTD